MDGAYRLPARHRCHLLVCLGTLIWLLGIAASPYAVASLEPHEHAVQVAASIQASPPQIKLHWPLSDSAGQYRIYRKQRLDLSWGDPIAQLPAAATSFTDTSVSPGFMYEYQIEEIKAIPPWPRSSPEEWIRGFGYINAGIQVGVTDARGKVILLVNADVASPLAQELARFQSDLVGDGWQVLRHDVSPSMLPSEVKALIRADYLADPAGVKALILFGHIPVPYSGNINPDLHGNHLGAWPADTYYADMDGEWTDHTVSSVIAENERNHNLPGDGKFDQSFLPSPVELQTGRIDFHDLPIFSPQPEVELLRQYLNKNHAFRHKQINFQRAGLICDNFGEIMGDAPAASAWRNFPPFFGTAQVKVVEFGNFFPALANDSYLWAYGGGGGGYTKADGIGTSQDFVTQDPRAAFLMLYGSYFGDWDTTDNFLRASLGSKSYSVATIWAGSPHWFAHHMALGATIGYSTLQTQNLRFLDLYKSQFNPGAGQVHVSLMGDPTLRMHPIAPPSNLSATVGDGVTLSWSPSPEPVEGYFVYRSSSPHGPFVRLTRGHLSNTTFHSSTTTSGTHTFLVRAMKLEKNSSGSYYNISQGTFVTIKVDDAPQLPILNIVATDPEADEANSDSASFRIERSEPTSASLTVQLQINGSASNGVDYESIPTTITLAAGSQSATIKLLPILDENIEGNETATISIRSNAAYVLGSAASATATIKDAPVNQPPQLSVLSDQSIPEDSSAELNLVISDPDTDLAALSFALESSEPLLIPLDRIVLAGSNSNRTLTLTPLTNSHGSATITVRVSDGELQAQRSFTLSVTPVNDAPSALADAIVADENHTKTLSASLLLANDLDVDSGDALTVTSVEPSAETLGTVQLQGSEIIYTPPANFSGSDAFTYTVGDAAGATDTAEVSVVVHPMLRIASFTGAPSNTILTFPVVAGRVYEIQTSTNLANWVAIATNIPPATGLETFSEDSSQGSAPRRFYRIVQTE